MKSTDDGEGHPVSMMTLCMLLPIVLLLVLFGPLSAKDLYVDGSYEGGPGDGSQGQPCKSISTCVHKYASDDDIIYIAPGIYNGTDNTGICSSYITRTNNCTATRLTLTGLHHNANEVIWSFAESSSPNARALVDHDDRFILIANMTIRDFTVIHNTTVTIASTRVEGGALEVHNSTLDIFNVQFINNSAASGGSIALVKSNITIQSSSFADNYALIAGGALTSRESSVRLNDTNFDSNRVLGNAATESFGEGGAVYFVGAAADGLRIEGGEFNNNTAPEAGGALHVQSFDHTVITGTIFRNNSVSGNGMCLFSSSACQVRGGALFSTVPGIVLTGATFISNTAMTSLPSQVAQGGAIYTTAAYKKTPSVKWSYYSNCTFVDNSANLNGGALFTLNQYTQVSGCVFTNNHAGIPDSLFGDESVSGGALWFSLVGTVDEASSHVIHSTFTGNYVWGGSGGAAYVTSSASGLNFYLCSFDQNIVVSSYTFPARGGALMLSHASMSQLSHSTFTNNSAAPRTDLGDHPRTLSGSGGAVFVQSANISVLSSTFTYNTAFSGQFDGGPDGGAIAMQDAGASVISSSIFNNNGAVGYVGSSSYGSSGSGGALSFTFSATLVYMCTFSENWVSAGGTYSSTGGAVAMFFDYSMGASLDNDQALLFEDCTFDSNYAFSQTCSGSTGSNAGEGGAMAIVGTYSPGVTLRNITFKQNMAVSRTGVLVLSYGGAISVALASNVTGDQLFFSQNVAFFGVGNDVGVLEGQGLLQNSVYLSNSHFYGSSDYESLTITMLRKAAQVCTWAQSFLNNVRPSSRSTQGLRMTSGSMARAEGRVNMRGHGHRNRQHLYQHEHMHHHDSVDAERAGERRDRRQLRGRRDFSLESRREQILESSNKHGNRHNHGRDHGYNSPGTSSVLLEDLDVNGMNFPSKWHYPAMLINTGAVELFNATFNGVYHMFVGNYDELFLGLPSTKGDICEAKIHGSIVQDALALTAFRSTVTALDSTRSDLTLDKVILMNATFIVGNNLTVTSNSTLIDSAMMCYNDPVHFMDGPIEGQPRLTFLGNLYTGFNVLNSADIKKFSRIAYFHLIDFPARIVLDGVGIIIANSLEFSTPRVSEISTPDSWFMPPGAYSDSDDPASATKEILNVVLYNDAFINVTEEAQLTVYSPTFIEAQTGTSRALENHGQITLDGSKLGLIKQIEPLPSIPNTLDDDGNRRKYARDANSLSSTLSVYGDFVQSGSGCTVITLNRTGQTQPVLNLVNNRSFLGHLGVNFATQPELSFYDGQPPSSWALVTFDYVQRADGNEQVHLSGPNGLGFSEQMTIIADNNDPARKENTSKNVFLSTYVLDSMSCTDAVKYSSYANQPNSGMYGCYVCLSNSSCNFCENGKCADASGGCNDMGGVLYESTCCPEDCNMPHGQCVANQENTEFECVCNPLYSGPSCKSLSNISIVIITMSVAFVVVGLVVMYNYRVSMGKKSQVLEELRQGLLYDNDGRDIDTINEAYIQSLQQGLILKDASVKFSEIQIEKQVGEGSFGVVYKATFRGASVAVKRMRAMFGELTNQDIEEFNKEAYMMSRLRHPNIVLVMGISFVSPGAVMLDEERLKRKGSLRAGIGPNGEEDDEDDEKDGKDKERMPRCVCVVTEFLEQGSLADILYGPRRLPSEIWTYDLILTCALQAARGMLYLHSHTPPICHRDLKSSNLVVDDHWVVKVTDFGMSRIVPLEAIDEATGVSSEAISRASAGSEAISRASGGSLSSQSKDISHIAAHGADNHEMTSNLGTTAWCAPEVLTSSNMTVYGVKVDVYSFGMVLWELWERKRPFDHLHSRFDVMDAIRSGHRPGISDDCPAAFRSLIQRCWQGDPNRRPMFQYIVRYLKDELARVKRKRERAINKGTNGGQSAGLGTAIIEDDESRLWHSDGMDRQEGTHVGSSASGVVDTVRDTFSRILPWGRTEDNVPRSEADSDLEAAANGAYVSMDNTNLSSSSAFTIGRDSLEARGPITRDSLQTFRTLDTGGGQQYIKQEPPVHASTPAELPSSSLQKRQSRQRQAEEKAQLRYMEAYEQKKKATEDAINTSLARARKEEPSAAQTKPLPNAAGTPPEVGKGASPSSNLLRSSTKARDKYVMKFNGWQPSQPDSGLPPSSGAAGGAAGTPRAGSFLSNVMGGAAESDTALSSPVPRRASESVDLEKIRPRASRVSRDSREGSGNGESSAA